MGHMAQNWIAIWNLIRLSLSYGFNYIYIYIYIYIQTSRYSVIPLRKKVNKKLNGFEF